MATKKEKVRLSISLDKDLNDRIEILANRLSMSKASLCNAIISQGIHSYELAWNIMSSPESMMKLAQTFSLDKQEVDDVSNKIKQMNEQNNE